MESFILKRRVFRFSAIAVLVTATIVTLRAAVRIHCQSSGGGRLPGTEEILLPSIDNEESRRSDLQAGLQIVNGIVSAYSNADDCVMFELAQQIPRGALALKGEDYTRLLLPINQVWLRFFVRENDGNPLLPTADFIRRMRAEIAMAKIYGQLIVASGRTSQLVLADIDWGVLERLQTYKGMFVRDGRTDCLEATEGFIGEWIRQIESPNGFIREYLRSQDSRLRPLIKRGLLTEIKLRKLVRSCAFPLTDQCGYTPKWLDKEFPPLPEETTKCEAEVSEK